MCERDTKQRKGIKMSKAVKVVGANQFVRGTAARYPYYAAVLYRARTTKDGRLIWASTGTHSQPRRSRRLAEQDAQEFAREQEAMLLPGTRSLHNQPVF
jgi:hypothetical protein